MVLLELADAEDWLSAGSACTLDSSSTVLELDLFRVLDLPVLLLLVYTVAGYHCLFPRLVSVEVDI